MCRILFILITLSAAAGCRREDVSVYEVAHEPPVSSARPAPGEAVSIEAPGHREVDWKTPASWQEQPPSAMRVGSFLIKGPYGRQADVSVVVLEGDAGGDLANVNRWRGQIGLGPVSADALDKTSEWVNTAGQRMRLIDFTAGSPAPDQPAQRVLAAISTRGRRTWFFKMAGDAEIVGRERRSFLAFLESLTFHQHD